MLTIEEMQKNSDIEIGDYVLVRQEKKNKLSTNFNPEPYKVIKKTGVLFHGSEK